MKSLASKLAKFVNPAPEPDPEDGYKQSTSGSESENEEARAHYVEVGKSALRHDEPDLDETKYSGKRVSRKQGDSDDEDVEENSEEESSSADNSGDELSMSGSEVESAVHSDAKSEQQSESGSESEQGSDAKPQPESHAAEPNGVAALLRDEKKQLLSRLASSGNQDAEKGKSVSQQIKIYEMLLDCRIVLQKALTYSHDPMADKTQVAESACDLINDILAVRCKLQGKSVVGKKRSLAQLAEQSFEMDTELAKERDTVLTKWSRKVQLSSANNALSGGSNFKSLNQSSARQVENVLGDMDRLVKRTRMNRSQYKVDGEVPEESSEIFDDTDFYRVLLTDLVDRRMAEKNSLDSVKWSIATRAAKSKSARDTSLSKGRKIKYDVQDKIVSFDAPRPTVFKWSEDQADDLFAGLLGVSISMDDNEPEEEIKVDDFNLFG